MIVAEFWAEARRHRPRGKDQRQITVRRLGWSDHSAEEAQRMAEARAEEAFGRLVRGEELPRRERKLAYNGAEGVPIREEILARHGDAVVTRNSYGTPCLNSPDVFFADIDFRTGPRGGVIALLFLAFFGAAITAAVHFGNVWVAVLGVLGSTFFSGGFAYLLFRIQTWSGGGAENIARRRVVAWSRHNPRARLRLYRTPAGLRVLMLHRTFDPSGEETASVFNALGTDEHYAKMCRRQRCFRARVGPKPWRIGIARHLKPRPGVWPVTPERLPGREAWVQDYERAATRFASCRFVEELGNGPVDAKAATVRDVHDRLARATNGFPLA